MYFTRKCTIKLQNAWHKFNEAMKDLVKQSYQNVELAVIDNGCFCFCPPYKQLVVRHDRWFRMTPKQRKNHLTKVTTYPLSKSLECGVDLSTDTLVPSTDKSQDTSLSPLGVAVDDADIQSLPLSVLQDMW